MPISPEISSIVRSVPASKPIALYIFIRLKYVIGGIPYCFLKHLIKYVGCIFISDARSSVFNDLFMFFVIYCITGLNIASFSELCFCLSSI